MPDIIIVGSIANTDLALADALIRHGLDCVVVRMQSDPAADIGALPGDQHWITAERLIVHSNSRAFYRLCSSAKCVISLTGRLPYHLGLFWFLLPLIRFPPIVNVTTGSDITELARNRGFWGMIYRQLLRRAAFNWVVTTPEALKSVRQLRLNNICFLRFPVMLERRAVSLPPRGPITYLHVSHLDWGITDNHSGRNSTKGNDRFFRAFFRAAAQGADIRCIVIDRGPDRYQARQLVESSGFADRFEWRPAVEPGRLANLLQEADIVVDQFDVGFFGLTAWEAMAQGKPVLIHLDMKCVDLLYESRPPALVAQNEEEIYSIIISSNERDQLHAIGDAAEVWVRHNHGRDIDFPKFIFRMAVAAGTGWDTRNLALDGPSHDP